jgi:hypothetical protein
MLKLVEQWHVYSENKPLETKNLCFLLIGNRGNGIYGCIFEMDFYGFYAIFQSSINEENTVTIKNSIQLECVSKAYIEDLVYLKRNTKILPDRWGLKTPPAYQSSLNEIVFRSHERSVKSLRKVDFSKMVKVMYEFFPQK